MSPAKSALYVILIFLAVIVAIGFFTYEKPQQNTTNLPNNMPTTTYKNIRPAAVAGSFYPSDKYELSEMIDKFLAEATTSTASGTPRIIISPHAGYIYSGPIAAAAFKSAAGQTIERIIIVGRSHQAYFDNIAADKHDAWETPLGMSPVDLDFIDELSGDGIINDKDSAHDKEHSLEVMLPFIQKTFGFQVKIVPLLFGNENPNTEVKLAEALSELMDDKTLVIISSDLSHYPTPENAKKLDKQTINAVLSNDADLFHSELKRIMNANQGQVETLACGETAIGMALNLSKKLGLVPTLIKSANSGEIQPESSANVVGYAAITFNKINMENPANTHELDNQEQIIALDIARETLRAYFDNKKYEPQTDGKEIFDEHLGAFVTLKIGGNLRGCIGVFEPDKPLSEVIKEMALSAAFDDPRFSPLTSDELDDIEIEISVLSPMQKIDNSDEIILGTHGVYVKQGRRTGVFLPQVATETGWDKEKFLNTLCTEKAGLSDECWKDPNTEIYTFTAQVFAE